MLIPIHRPATVSPNTLRSLSAVSSFKPFSYTEQPSSLPYHGWTITEAQETPPIPPQIDNEPHSLSNEPIIDEAGRGVDGIFRFVTEGEPF